jgi:hypothetical protein
MLRHRWKELGLASFGSGVLMVVDLNVETSDDQDDDNKTRLLCETISSNPMYLRAVTKFSYPRDKNGRMKANGVVKEANPRVKRSIRPIAYVKELIEPQLSEQQQGVSNGEAIRAPIYIVPSILLLSCSLCNAIGSIAFSSSFRLGL